MNPRLKMAMMRRRRSDGTYMERSPDRMGSMAYPYYPRPTGEYRDRTGREHYDNGRYAPMRSEYYPEWGQPEMPSYEMEQRQGEGRPMNRIGFALPEEVRSTIRDEVGYRKGHKEQGHAMSYGQEEPFSQEEAMEWVHSMQNADGTKGEHYSMEQVQQIMEQQRIQCDSIEFYAAMNMMYSDYCKVAKKFNCSTPEFYACLAKAFLDDKDAVDDKLAKYYQCIVKH